ncbi:MAG: META domain-containing protein [Symploca sp. SIO2E9]|nr:META domain-containing protein [Symploca sp. SIO2E9]
MTESEPGSITNLEGNWQLTGSLITISFTKEVVSGQMFCNTYFGTYTTSTTSTCEGEIKLDSLACTQVGCQENSQEYQYLKALQSATSYLVSETTLSIGELEFSRVAE